MIQDVDESLRALVKRDALNGSKADVAFDAPNKEWSSRRNTPTVDVYLYDIRGALDKSEATWKAIPGARRAHRTHPAGRAAALRFALSDLAPSGARAHA